MELTYVLIALLAILFIGPVIWRETFVDISDNSGTVINLSLTDLMSLFGTTQAQQAARQTQQQPIIIQSAPAPAAAAAGTQSSLDSQFYSSLKDSILTDVRQTIADELPRPRRPRPTVIRDTCIDSMAAEQGADFMRYIPGKNPADYIRKDSIPCYGCSLK
jgi:hypothetical protein